MNEALPGKDIIRRVVQGQTLREIARKSKKTPATLRQILSRENRRLGMTTHQRALMERLSELGLWHEQTSRPSWAITETKSIKAQADFAVSGLGVSYVISRPPEMEFVYMNRQSEVVHRTDLKATKGKSVWELMAAPEIYERIRNLEEYHTKGIMVAKAILQIGTWLGQTEATRAQAILKPYVDFAVKKLPGPWKTLRPDIYAISAAYPKRLTHWDANRDGELLFEVRWNYRPAWRAFEITYEPRDSYTVAEMVSLRQRLNAA